MCCLQVHTVSLTALKQYGQAVWNAYVDPSLPLHEQRVGASLLVEVRTVLRRAVLCCAVLCGTGCFLSMGILCSHCTFTQTSDDIIHIAIHD